MVSPKVDVKDQLDAEGKVVDKFVTLTFFEEKVVERSLTEMRRRLVELDARIAALQVEREEWAGLIGEAEGDG